MNTIAELTDHLIRAAGPSWEIAPAMEDLTAVLRTFQDVTAQRETRVQLGDELFDVVITGSDAQARAAVAEMDVVQGRCGPVIEDPDAGWLYWLVPPGSSQRWEPHPYAACLGAPHTIILPPLSRALPPGPYWLRPSASDRLVPAGPLWDAPPLAAAAQLGVTP
ncbi:hypothetical protein OG462_42540 [Streptomyces sp. NBC_01077]|uniref:hypothetical protein n=1 Tax=Streptomyces sp. NBC_01077 TaxID=2903746 RepID=UPI003868CD3D|nr:hypothetical protein OG462_02480 [Streptomyces sp. NBC_01077]WSV43519.1 hypothetical protein OG462_42540 [Streptomyces sp. NBC_01077]